MALRRGRLTMREHDEVRLGRAFRLPRHHRDGAARLHGAIAGERRRGIAGDGGDEGEHNSDEKRGWTVILKLRSAAGGVKRTGPPVLLLRREL